MSTIDAYLAGPKDHRAAVDGLSREQLASRPVPGKWSVLEVVCHLAVTDANIAHRINRVLSEDRPSFERVQPDRMLAALAYHAQDVEEELAAFEITRRQIARILNASPPGALERTGVMGDRGERTVAQMVNGAVEHLAHHLKFVVEKRQALAVDGPDNAFSAHRDAVRATPESRRAVTTGGCAYAFGSGDVAGGTLGGT
jgi:uncharacterized damage-inducible protein DinB